MTGPVTPIILCGGAGARLWPASVDMQPKPFLPLVGGRSTFELTLQRVANQELFAPPIVVANVAHRYLVEAALARAGATATVLLEPEARDTAPAIITTAAWLAETHPGALMLVLPADHAINDVAAFDAAVRHALPAAQSGKIAIFGIRPTFPATSFGYIRPGETIAGLGAVRSVAAFVEKPAAKVAEDYVAAGYAWNGGMFMMRAETALEQAATHAPDVLVSARSAAAGAAQAGSTVTFDATSFRQAPKISIDYAIMEKTSVAAVVDATFDWSDLGTWSAVWDAAARDDDDNAIDGEAVLLESGGNLVRSDRPVIGLLGVTDMIVVAGEDAVLVAPRNRAEAVKSLAAALGKQSERLVGGHARHYRPWGYYQSLDVGAQHQVKRIVVRPGGRLSLQKHAHRSEHWTVVAGVAEVTVEKDIRLLRENQTVFIPLGAIHRMANPGETEMILIEVQFGTYLGEDDIIRIEDDYGRQ